jgi:hypothetical protein
LNHEGAQEAATNQRGFASAECAMNKKRTRREKFVAEMERIVPYARLLPVFEPLYPNARAGLLMRAGIIVGATIIAAPATALTALLHVH